MSKQDSNDTAALELSRRKLLAAAASVGGLAMTATAPALAATTKADFSGLPPYGNGTLPPGVRARLIPNINGLTVNILEAGFETPGRPLVLMLHGFPNLAYSWRKVMPALAAAGYYAVAPDCRGFGRTSGWDDSWDADPLPFLAVNMLRDQVALVSALGYRSTAMMVGHDQGSGFRRAAIISVQYGQRRSRAASRIQQRRTRRGVCETQSSAERLSGLLEKPRRRSGHEACGPGNDQFLPRILLHEKCRLLRQPESSADACGAHR